MAEHPEVDLDSEYIAGLLDGVSRVHFDVSESADGSFHVRPLLRIKPYGTEIRRNLIGSVLELEDISYYFVKNSNSHNYFSVDDISGLQRLRELLAGESAHLIRELDFIFEVFEDEFVKTLAPKKVYQFLLTREKLRYGNQYGGPNVIRPSDVAAEYNVDTDVVNPLQIPDGSVRGGTSVDWMAGVFDGLARYRPAVWRDKEFEIGFGMTPIVRLYKGGAHPLFSHFVSKYFEDNGLDFSDADDNPHTVHFTLSGTTQIQAVLDDLLEDLLVLAEQSLILLEEILPRFEEGLHHEKQGFYDILTDFEYIGRASGVTGERKRYDSDFFEDRWCDEIITPVKS